MTTIVINERTVRCRVLIDSLREKRQQLESLLNMFYSYRTDDDVVNACQWDIDEIDKLLEELEH